MGFFSQNTKPNQGRVDSTMNYKPKSNLSGPSPKLLEQEVLRD